MDYTIQLTFFLLLLPATFFAQDESSAKPKYDVFSFDKKLNFLELVFSML
jgi:hypothetical protein